jgi:hypothetical protein
MPTKKPNLFQMSGREPSKEKLPTMSQYLKQNTDVKYPLYSTLTTIWFPGTWDNYSLESKLFRINIGTNHPLYSAIDSGIVRLLEETDTALLIELMDGQGTVGIRESSLYGKYSRIGNAGYKFSETLHAN